GAAGLLLGYPSALFGDRISRKISVGAGALLASAGAALAFGAFPIRALTQTQILTLAAVGAAVIGAGYALYSNVMAYAQEVVEDSWRGSAVGLLFTVYNLGTMAGGPLMTLALASSGYREAGLLVIAVPYLISFLLFLPAPGRKEVIRS
ncbi:MAG: MFS transporter, partial [Thermoprotei archaeon]